MNFDVHNLQRRELVKLYEAQRYIRVIMIIIICEHIFQAVSLVEVMYLVFHCMPGGDYRRRLFSSSFCLGGVS